jgi:hypothetical protein
MVIFEMHRAGDGDPGGQSISDEQGLLRRRGLAGYSIQAGRGGDGELWARYCRMPEGRVGGSVQHWPSVGRSALATSDDQWNERL